MSVFNRCIETGNVLLILECWQDVHPALVSIPVKWEYSSPYGLLYALNPPDDVMQFENNGRILLFFWYPLCSLFLFHTQSQLLFLFLPALFAPQIFL